MAVESTFRWAAARFSAKPALLPMLTFHTTQKGNEMVRFGLPYTLRSTPPTWESP